MISAVFAGVLLASVDPAPKVLEHAGVTERLEARIPRDLPFVDETGRAVTLGDLVGAGKPVILTLNYYRCPMLCTLELNGLVEGLKTIGWTIGKEFDVVTVSFDPKETPALAAAKKTSYLGSYGRSGAESGWRFLTGPAASIDTLTSTVGFEYGYDAESDQYGHPAVVVLITPDGRVSRYLYGVAFDRKTLELGLLEAGQGRSGSAWERFLLYCYHFDPSRGRYSLAAMKLMRIGGGATVLALSAVLSSLWLRERRRRTEQRA